MCLQMLHVGRTGNTSQGKTIVLLYRGCERGDFKRLFNCHFHLVATRWKYYKTPQLISSLRELEKTEVTRWRGQ